MDIPSSEIPVPKRQADLSKSAVLLLVVIAVVISVLSTWVVLEEIGNIKGTPVVQEARPQSGHVSLRVIEPGGQMASAQGKVSLNVIQEVN